MRCLAEDPKDRYSWEQLFELDFQPQQTNTNNQHIAQQYQIKTQEFRSINIYKGKWNDGTTYLDWYDVVDGNPNKAKRNNKGS